MQLTILSQWATAFSMADTTPFEDRRSLGRRHLSKPCNVTYRQPSIHDLGDRGIAYSR